MRLRSLATCLAPLSLGLVACAQPVVTVEVMPPRTSVTCAAPGVEDPALGRGLLDAKATVGAHGGYVADLRMVVSGIDARVDGVDIKLSRDGKEVKVLENVPTGDVLLVGQKDDVRKGLVENVEIIPRDVAVSLAADTKVTDVEFTTLVAEISPRLLSPDVSPASSTFALDVCNGCLVIAPPDTECAVVTKNPVCRVGQDVPSFTCAQDAGSAP